MDAAKCVNADGRLALVRQLRNDHGVVLCLLPCQAASGAEGHYIQCPPAPHARIISPSMYIYIYPFIIYVSFFLFFL